MRVFAVDKKKLDEAMSRVVATGYSLNILQLRGKGTITKRNVTGPFTNNLRPLFLWPRFPLYSHYIYLIITVSSIQSKFYVIFIDGLIEGAPSITN